jgi:hypothetical protein
VLCFFEPTTLISILADQSQNKLGCHCDFERSKNAPLPVALCDGYRACPLDCHRRRLIAGGPFEDFKNDALVVEAAKNILGMNRAELDAFIAYLASCSASQSGSMKDFYCEREHTLFLVKFGRGRSIDRMIRVLSVIDKYFQQSDKSSKKLATKELANMERFVEVLGRFEDTASLRSRELIKEGR